MFPQNQFLGAGFGMALQQMVGMDCLQGLKKQSWHIEFLIGFLKGLFQKKKVSCVIPATLDHV